MKIVTNEKLVKRNKKVATWLFFSSLGILFLGFFVANGQLFGITDVEETNGALYFLAMPIVLAVGFSSTLISVRMTNLWIRHPRPEDAIQNNLKGLSNKSALYNYFHFPARHVLICPQGIFPIVTRFQDGRFSVKGDKWRTHRSLLSQFFAIFRMDGIGNPTREALEAQRFIKYIVEDYDPDLPVQPLIVFVDPRAELTIEDPTVPVLYTDLKKEPNLKDYLHSYSKSDTLGDSKRLTDFIAEFEAATIIEES